MSNEEFLQQWKDDIVESLSKYDANSIEEVYQCGIERGRLEERRDWENAAAELLIKYDGDIYQALPEIVKQIKKNTINTFVKEYKEWSLTPCTTDRENICEGMCIDCFVNENRLLMEEKE